MSSERGAKRIGYLDLEANGYYEGVTRVHCLAYAIGDGDVNLVVGEEGIRGALQQLDICDVLVAHNGIGYDFPVLWKLLKYKPKPLLVDTYLMSTVLCADEEHSLQSWGERVGRAKIEYTLGFDDYNDEMGEYCKGDVETLRLTHRRLMEILREQVARGKPGANGKVKDPGLDPRPAILLEHEFAKVFAAQWMRGVMIDRPRAEQLVNDWRNEMTRIELEIEPHMPETPMNKGELAEWTPPKLQFKKDGTPSAMIEKWADKLWQHNGIWHLAKGGVVRALPFTEPVKAVRRMELRDQQALKEWLMSAGWVPTMWNYQKAKDKHGKLRVVRDGHGEPVRSWPKFHDKGKLCEALESVQVEMPLAKEVVLWMVLRHRTGLVQSIVDAIRPDGTVPATGRSNGTPTCRVTHEIVANVPKADPDVMFGVECRSIFIARSGRKLGGVDASGLEMRCLAHYMGDAEFTDFVVNGKKEEGTDVITVMWMAAREFIANRGIGKPCLYGWLYGAAPRKTGETAQATQKEAKRVGESIQAAWMDRFPRLAELLSRCESAADRGYLIALDGRLIPIRNPHAALNTLLQSCGSIIVKTATVYAAEQRKLTRIDAIQVVHMHDELVLDSANEATARLACQQFVDGLVHAEHQFNFRCPLTGDMQIGIDWSQIH